MENQKTKELTNFHYISLTDVGKARANNEDSSGYFDTPNGHVFVVCDGCGGMPCGERASQGVVNSMKFFFNNFYYKNPTDAIRDAIKYAHNFLISEGSQYPSCEGMATTVVLVLVRYNKVYYGHVGDSRIYFFSGRDFRQITKDDSYVQHLVDQGKISPQEAETHPRKNELMQVMGQLDSSPTPHVCREPLIPANGDMILLCTDGLFNMVPYNDIRAILSQRGYIEDKGMVLMKTGLTNGGLDNITFQIIKFFDMEMTADTTSQSPIVQEMPAAEPPARTPITIAITTMVIIILSVLLYLRENKRQESYVPDSGISSGTLVKYDLDTVSNADSILAIFGLDRQQAIFTSDNGHDIMCIPVKGIITTRYYDNLNTLEILYQTPKEKIIRANNLRDGIIEPAQKIIIPQ